METCSGDTPQALVTALLADGGIAKDQKKMKSRPLRAGLDFGFIRRITPLQR